LSTWSIRYRRATAWVIRLGRVRRLLGRVRRLEGGLSDSVSSPASAGLSFLTSGPFVQLACIARGNRGAAQKKNAVIYGAGGAVGGAVARTFAREGANVFLAGRMLESIDTVAKEIAADGDVVEIAQVDALDENAVEQHIDAVAKKVDRIDVVFNARI
jgi:NADPH:quinone reductase-like Zn-dependent oxidoreductase